LCGKQNEERRLPEIDDVWDGTHFRNFKRKYFIPDCASRLMFVGKGQNGFSAAIGAQPAATKYASSDTLRALGAQ
jgi:hypothetical protein